MGTMNAATSANLAGAIPQRVIGERIKRSLRRARILPVGRPVALGSVRTQPVGTPVKLKDENRVDRIKDLMQRRRRGLA